MAFTEYTGDTTIITDLGTSVQERGLTTEQFKAAFDQFGTEFVTWFNGTHLPNVAANISNKTLLHNWDFRNPVNQRGLSSYTLVSIIF